MSGRYVDQERRALDPPLSVVFSRCWFGLCGKAWSKFGGYSTRGVFRVEQYTIGSPRYLEASMSPLYGPHVTFLLFLDFPCLIDCLMHLYEGGLLAY